MATRYFVPRCLLKCHSVKLSRVRVTKVVVVVESPGKLFYVLQFERHPESSSAITLLLHADWMMLKNASNQGGANSVTVLSARNPGRGCWSLRKLHFSNSLAVSTWIFNGSSIECHEKKH